MNHNLGKNTCFLQGFTPLQIYIYIYSYLLFTDVYGEYEYILHNIYHIDSLYSYIQRATSIWIAKKQMIKHKIKQALTGIRRREIQLSKPGTKTVC